MAISGSVNGAQPSNGGLMSSLATPDNISGMRMAVPVIKSVEDLKAVKDAYSASNAARYAYNGMAMGGAYGGGFGGVVSGAGRGIFGALGNALHSLPSLLKSNFLISGAMSLFTNAISLVTGKETGSQFLADSACDTVAYTGIGAAATTIGGMVGSIIPGIGTIIGMGVGALVGFLGGKLYETYLRPSFTGWAQAKVAGMGNNSSSASTATPTSTTAPGSPYSLPTAAPAPGSMPSAPVLAPAH